MLELLTNIEGKQFKVTDVGSLNKLLPNSKGFIVDIHTISRYQDSIAYQTVNSLVYRFGKTGKYRLKHVRLHLPLVKSSDAKIDEIVRLKTPIEISADECIDVREYKNEKFVAWLLANLLKVKLLTYNVLNAVFDRPKMVKKYLAAHPDWARTFTLNILIQDLLQLYNMASGNTIDKDGNIITAFGDVGVKEEMIDTVSKLKALTATLQMYRKNNLLNNMVNTFEKCRSHALRNLHARGCTEQEIHSSKIKPREKYEGYDKVANGMYKLCAAAAQKSQYYSKKMIPFRMNY